MLVVGLTGGVGSGKSTVAALFRAAGAEVIDADRLARDAVAPGEPALAEIREAFGADVIAEDGRLDRAALAARVFGDEAARGRLNAIVHPAVGRRAAAAFEAARARGAAWVVYDVPLLYENGLEAMCDVVVVVDAPEPTRRERLSARSGWSEDEISARFAAQLPLAEKVRRADHVIDNSGDPEATREQVAALVERLVGRDA